MIMRHTSSTALFLAILLVFAAFGQRYILGSATADAQTTALVGSSATSTGSLQSQIDANDQQIASLNAQIAQYQVALQQVGADKKTLQAAINALNLQRSKVEAQVAVTQKQIDTTQLQIQQLGGQIQSAAQTIAQSQASLGEYLVNLQKDDHKSLLASFLESENLSQVWGDANATLQIQAGVEEHVQALHSQENVLSNSKAMSQQKQQTLVSQQQTLAEQQQSLNVTVQSKNELLAETNAKESTYEKLLAAAQAELNSFSAFTQNAGGSKLLAGQTNCDAWGCYYSQRDALWGGESLNGTKYTLASDGCLVTAMAMVMTHYGYRDVTPATINADPTNFASYYPAYLLTTISVDGVSATRKISAIDATLATGNPVIAGIHAYGGTHYVVLVSGARGSYIMRDPYIANGKDISFTGSYSLKSIFSVANVTISG